MVRSCTRVCTLILIVFWFVVANGVVTADTSKNTTHFIPKTDPTDLQLTDTTWQLVKIMLMDDSTFEPEGQPKYTLKFNEDGTVVVQAGCYRAAGTWSSIQPGHLLFGQIAPISLQCAPNSLSDKYLAQFAWVRSYVIEKVNLHLATMADGSIMEFQPMINPATATVLGEEIFTSDDEVLQQEIISRLFEQYSLANNIKATDEEIDKYLDRMQRRMADDPNLVAMDDLTAEETAQAEAMQRDIASALISQWKLNRALYQEYGGRIIFQQFGPEPLDAYRQYLQERQADGDFAIHEKAFEDKFWRYFTDDTMHSFYPSGSEEEAQALGTPPWSRKADNE